MFVRTLIPAAALALFCGCATMEHSPAPGLSCKERWVVLPLDNFTEVPHAARSAERLAQNVLRSLGVPEVLAYPDGLLDTLAEFGATSRKYEKALEWARGQNIRYGVKGSVAEWRYKSGMDGEPAVGLTLEIVDVESGRGLWSAGGARTGWYWDAVSGVAQKLIRQLLGAAAVAC